MEDLYLYGFFKYCIMRIVILNREIGYHLNNNKNGLEVMGIWQSKLNGVKLKYSLIILCFNLYISIFLDKLKIYPASERSQTMSIFLVTRGWWYGLSLIIEGGFWKQWNMLVNYYQNEQFNNNYFKIRIVDTGRIFFSIQMDNT